MQDEEYGKIKNYALKLLSIRPRSVAEIKKRLTSYIARKKFPVQILDRLIKELADLNFLNDKDFALWWLDQRGRANIKGKTFIRAELLQKGIDREVIAEVLNGLEPEQELDKAFQLAEKKFASVKISRETEFKIGRYLTGRGFSYDIIKKVIDSLRQRS